MLIIIIIIILILLLFSFLFSFQRNSHTNSHEWFDRDFCICVLFVRPDRNAILLGGEPGTVYQPMGCDPRVLQLHVPREDNDLLRVSTASV